LAASNPVPEPGDVYIYQYHAGPKKTSIMGAKLDFYPRVQAKAIVRQIFIHLLLIMEPGDFWIEVLILVRWEALFPFSSIAAFSSPTPPTTHDFSPFFIATEMRKMMRSEK